MTLLALSLILVAALIHASWNLLLKKTADKTAFSLLFLWVATVLFLPSAAWSFWHGPALAPKGWLMTGLSVLFESGYWLMLAQTYQQGDISAAYPLVRGTGALMAAIFGVSLLGEHLTLGLILGLLLVLAGGYAIYLPGFRWRDLASPWRQSGSPALRLAVATGVLIGAYSVVDREATGILSVPIFFYSWLCYAGSAVVLTVALGKRKWGAMRQMWQEHWRTALAVGVMSPVTYLLVLSAMAVSPVSRVAAAREISLVWGTLLGRWVLREQVGWPRLIGAGSIALGVIALAFSRG